MTSTTTRADRIQNALQSLLERLVPSQLPSERDDSLADQRWESANAFANEILTRPTPTPNGSFSASGNTSLHTTEDVNHAADLIRRRFIEAGEAPKAARFANLYARLLAQPVLGKKWGILWFLLRTREFLDEDEDEDDDDDDDDDEDEDDDDDDEDGVETQTRPQQTHQQQPPPRPHEQLRHRTGSLMRSPPSAKPTAKPIPQDRTPSRLTSSVRLESEMSPPPLQRPASFTSPTKSVPPSSSGGAAAKPPSSGGGKNARPTEPALLRDLPFALQGLSSTHLPFSDSRTLKIPPTLPVPLVALVHTLAEPSLLYRSLADYVESSEPGLIGQSLRSALGVELRSYLSLVATLEAQIRRALTQIDEDPGKTGLGRAGVTLKRCVVWTREATLGLRLMSSIVESARGKKGGELIGLIHTFASSHGDPFVHAFAERLLAQVTKPFYDMLRAWIYGGELEDPYLEFFVAENPDHEDSGATSVWEHKYRVREAMLPSIVTSEFANRVFLIGKSLNFIRYACRDAGWVESYRTSTSRELKYGDMAMLSSSIDEAYRTVMARLTSLMEDKFALSAHLAALKKYLLLGQGDFIALLMESLASNLDRPANSQYRHTLTAQLEHAIRNSNAQHDRPDVLRRLDARMLELSHGEIGWDVFTLEYRVDAPLDVIVTPWASKQYLKVFNFLWRVKRVEFALATTWRRVQTGARGVLAALERDDPRLARDWKAARGRLAEMVHLVNQLQYYILFEVIEAGWAGLQRAVRKPDATLDTLISAHTAYLRAITRKGLLGGGVAGAADFTAQLHELLKLMLAYRDAVDGLYSHSLAEFTRRQDRAAQIDARTRAGRWGVHEGDDDDELAGPGALADPGFPPPLIPLNTATNGAAHGADTGDRSTLEGLRRRLASLEVDFRARVNVLLGDLAHQPDVDMRFLAVVMNFNDVYAPVKRRKGKPTDTKEKSLATGTAAAMGSGTVGRK